MPEGSCCKHKTTNMENAQRRFARLYKADEAQIMLENLPSDLSEEEDDSDTDDPLYEPELEMT